MLGKTNQNRIIKKKMLKCNSIFLLQCCVIPDHKESHCTDRDKLASQGLLLQLANLVFGWGARAQQPRNYVFLKTLKGISTTYKTLFPHEMKGNLGFN